MQFTWDTIYVVNLIFCIIIFVFGLMAKKKSKSPAPLYVGLGFIMFGISHLAKLFGIAADYKTILIIVRLCGYLLVTFAVYTMAFGKKK